MKRFRYYRNLSVAALLSLSVFHWPYIQAMSRKAMGREEPCPWGKLIREPWTMVRFKLAKAVSHARIRYRETDAVLDIERFDSPTRPFWIKRAGLDMDGKNLLAFVLAEQDLIAAYAPTECVRPGEVVVDIGAHIGTFGDEALRRGASKVIMVEPDPINVECIRRNFPKEIADGRVVLVPEGAWSSVSTLEFKIGTANSGMGSFVMEQQGAQKLLVRVRPLDEILKDLQIPKVDFIKVDIEGAEREALKGAMQTLRNNRPRLLMDMYHLPDDSVVLPRLIHNANAGYQEYCAVCSPSGGHIISYATFFRVR